MSITFYPHNDRTYHVALAMLHQTGKALLCSNNSRIPAPILRDLIRIIEANSGDIIKKWFAHVGQIDYYC